MIFANWPAELAAGSAALNERIRALALEDLRKEDYLLEDTVTRMVEGHVVPQFESIKQGVDFADKNKEYPFYVTDLRDSGKTPRTKSEGVYILF